MTGLWGHVSHLFRRQRHLRLRIEDISRPIVWDVIESHAAYGVFGEEKHRIKGYIPREVLTLELGLDMTSKCTWFNREESAAIHAHPLFRTTL